MSKFKVGDKVRIRQWADMEQGHAINSCGSIVLNGNGFTKGMRELCGQTAIVESISGESVCLGQWSGKGEHSWGYVMDMLEPADAPQKIVITTDGPTTLARLYDGKKVTKTATAKCSPKDTFDFAVGAKLAYDRLMGAPKADKPTEDKPQQEPVKLYCVKDLEPGDGLTKGKVYMFENNDLRIDQQDFYDYYDSYEQFKHKNPDYASCLVPLVKRPAKVGEWVYVTHTDYLSDLKVGDIAKVKRVNTAKSVFISKPDGHHPNGLNFSRHEYLVLDGYDGRHEQSEKREYKVGDVVRLVSERPDTWNWQGYMDGYLGKEVKITEIDGHGFKFLGSRNWSFALDDIDCLVKAVDE